MKVTKKDRWKKPREWHKSGNFVTITQKGYTLGANIRPKFLNLSHRALSLHPCTDHGKIWTEQLTNGLLAPAKFYLDLCCPWKAKSGKTNACINTTSLYLSNNQEIYILFMINEKSFNNSRLENRRWHRRQIRTLNCPACGPKQQSINRQSVIQSKCWFI